MAEIPNIDFGRAATLMDVVQKVAGVAPAFTALSSVAMGELKEMNEAAQEYLNELGRERLRAEQEAAAKLNAENQAAAEEQARIDEDRRRQQAVAVKPITVMPGEPNPLPEIEKRQESMEPDPEAPVVRRV